MPEYQLNLEVWPDTFQIVLKLLNEHGMFLAGNQVTLSSEKATLWEGLLDTRNYIERFAGNMLRAGKPVTADELLVELGEFLGNEVLGPEIFRHLTERTEQRTLLVQLPAATENYFVQALARLPWELARTENTKSLLERNVLVRIQMDDENEETSNHKDTNEPVRVLLVLAETPGSRPLAMRQEREELLYLFERAILPTRNVEIDVLCHGVTEKLLREQVQRRGGYHIVHWSGHGHINALELLDETGKASRLTGEQLAAIFQEAGGFIPRLFFLSACLSGAVVKVTDWASLEAALRESQTGNRGGQSRELSKVLGEETGYAGTALALRKAGVPEVVAMRYEVSDPYARRLAGEFYQRLLADDAHHTVAAALSQARTELASEGSTSFFPVDHATPVLFAKQLERIAPAHEESEQLSRWYPQPEPLLPAGNRELNKPERFVGRSRELTRLATQWLSSEEIAVAEIQGLAGLGKTALAAETLHLYHSGRFAYVFVFQAKPQRLTLDDFYQQLDRRLLMVSKTYRTRIERNANRAVYLPVSDSLRGAERYELLRNNLISILRVQRILLVLDNFENNLQSGPTGAYICEEPEWNTLLAELAEQLPGTNSRLLITTRHRISTLPAARTLWIPLGPLPIGEAALYLQNNPDLWKLYYRDEEGKQLVEKLLAISRGHPLIMERLSRMARTPLVLGDALEKVKAEGYATLPNLFTTRLTDAERAREMKYLEEVAVGSVDLLISRLSPDARRLLWIITLANEPVTVILLKVVYKELFANIPKAPNSADMSQDATHRINTLLIEPLLAELSRSGLVTQAGEDAKIYSSHDLVREQIVDWMGEHPKDTHNNFADNIWAAYGNYYASLYHQLFGQQLSAATQDIGQRALVYLIRAREYNHLTDFAHTLITGSSSPAFLKNIIVELQAIIGQELPSDIRAALHLYLADALRRSGNLEEAMPLYPIALAEAEEAKEVERAAAISTNYANALQAHGELSAAQEMYRLSAEKSKSAGRPSLSIIGAELEALRIEVLLGSAEQALPKIMNHLNEIRNMRQRSQSGIAVSEMPDELLVRTLVSGITVAIQANQVIKQSETSLGLLTEAEIALREIGGSEDDLAKLQLNKGAILLSMGRVRDAQLAIEVCLPVFQRMHDISGQASCLSVLAHIWHLYGDITRAIEIETQALTLRNRLSEPHERAISHNNLSLSLLRAGKTEASEHLMASIIYKLVGNFNQDLRNSIYNIVLFNKQQYRLPRIREVITKPEFHILKAFLDQRQVDMGELQVMVDALVETAEQQNQNIAPPFKPEVVEN